MKKLVKPLLTTQELCKFLGGCERRTVATLRKRGMPYAGRTGKGYLYDIDAVRNWLEEQKEVLMKKLVKPLLTTQELCKFLGGCERRTVATLRKRGMPYAGRTGKGYLYDIDAVRNWLEEQKEGA